MEIKELKILKSNRDIHIMKDEKGNATIIMDTKSYKDKMHDHLMNVGFYRKLNKDPSAKII